MILRCRRGLQVVAAASTSLIVCISLLACGPSAPAPETPPTSSATQAQTPPFETQDGFAWITAACGGPSLMDASPNSWLPRASPVALCMTPAGRAPVLVGVYDDASAGADDMAKIEGQHGYATRKDDQGRLWLFVVEGTDPASLSPLERYGFTLS